MSDGTMDKRGQGQTRAERARQNFLAGYNCSQSVVLAFDDVLAERGLTPELAARLASPFGGGMGRMREVCGAVSGMLMVLGVVEGYDDPKARETKAELYRKVQQLASAYREANGSIVCRELLGLASGPSDPTPEARTEAYYRKRPCADLCACAAGILEEHLSR